MIASAKDILGKGLYSPAEAALYARIRTRTMNRWLYGSAQGDSVVIPEIEEFQKRKVVSFLDFVQALAIREIRTRHRVPLAKIREAYDEAKKIHGIAYPFAVEHRTYLFGNPAQPERCNIVIRTGANLADDEQYFQVSGKNKGNQIFGPVLEAYKKDLSYRPDGLASEYIAFGHGDATVKLNPEIRFGEPVVTNCGYTALTLLDAYNSEGSVAAAAKAYGVSENDVFLACQYFDFLAGVSAA